MNTKKQVLIFYSRLVCGGGDFKTRLGREIENQQLANTLAQSLIKDTLAMIYPENGEYDLVYFYQPGLDDDTSCLEKIQAQYPLIQFKEQDVNADVEKIGEAFTHFTQKGYERIVMIGSDIPQLTKQAISEAFSHLSEYQAVIHPTKDKGYALVGIQQNIDIFSAVSNWQSRTKGYNLIKETRAICQQENYRLVEQQPVLLDLDYLDDLKSIISNITEHGKLKPEYAYLNQFFTIINTDSFLSQFLI